MADPNATPAPLTPEQRIHRAHEMITALCKPRGSAGSREWMMTIPARPDHDPDLVIGDGLDAGREALAELDATRAKLAQAEALRATSEAQLASLSPKLTDAESRVAALTEALADLPRFDLEGCDGDSGCCRARMDLDKYGDYVQYDDVERIIAALSPSQDTP